MDVLFCSLTPDMTDEEVKECIHKMHPRCVESGQGFLLTISGYDKDPRALWEIPQVVDFFRKLIDIGFLSVLALNAQAVMPGTAGFGAVEVWMVATGRISGRRNVPIEPEDFKAVFQLIEESNVKVAKILSDPCPNTGIKEHEQRFGKSGIQEIGKTLRTPGVVDSMKSINDGPTRHGYNYRKPKKEE